MNKIKQYTKEILSFALILFIITNILSYYRSMSLNQQDFNLQNIKLIDGFNYAYSKDEVLVVHFWATWCPICKVEAPNIQHISNTTNTLTIATSSGNDMEVKKYLKQNNLSFDVINDKDGKLAQQFNIQAFPTTLIYGKNHKLIFTDVGYTSTLSLKLKIWWASL
jgi:thiol-disulfide isomerase/thioredoxin